MKSVLYISYDGLTDSLGQSQILPYLIGLKVKGNKVSILTCEKPDNYKKNKSIVQQKCEEHDIDWNYTMYSNKYPIISPFLNTGRLRKRAEEIFNSNSFNIVHCRSIIPAQIGFRLCKNSKAKLIFDIRGFWANERVDGGIWDLSNPIYWTVYQYFKNSEKQLFRDAESIVTLTENAKNYIKDNFENQGNFTVVPCCADTSHFDINRIDLGKVNQLKSKFNIPESHYVLTYIGSLGARYKLSEMLDFFKVLQAKVPNSTFLFISKSDTSKITDLAHSKGIKRDSIKITSCEYSEIPTYISMANASIFFIVSSFSGKAVSPIKQAEVLSLGLPIIANTGLGDTDKILLETNIGIVVEDFKKADYEMAVNRILEFKRSKEEIRAEALKLFTVEMGIDRYHKLYQSL